MHFPHHVTHQLFLEPEGWQTGEVYVQGLFTGMPEEVQLDMLHSIPALRQARIMRPGYAIEYDHVPPYQIKPSLETKAVAGLFLGGQINGTSGYEEAAAQGLMAGINAARYAQDRAPVILGRDQAYIGVLIDDLGDQGARRAVPHHDVACRIPPASAARQCRPAPVAHRPRDRPVARCALRARPAARTRQYSDVLAPCWGRPGCGQRPKRTIPWPPLACLQSMTVVNGLQLLRRPDVHFDLLAALFQRWPRRPQPGSRAGGDRSQVLRLHREAAGAGGEVPPRRGAAHSGGLRLHDTWPASGWRRVRS